MLYFTFPIFIFVPDICYCLFTHFRLRKTFYNSAPAPQKIQHTHTHIFTHRPFCQKCPGTQAYPNLLFLFCLFFFSPRPALTPEVKNKPPRCLVDYVKNSPYPLKARRWTFSAGSAQHKYTFEWSLFWGEKINK